MGAIPFGRQVRERRRALDLTQDELARRVGCAAITIRKIEAGALRASQQVAERLAVSLAVPPDERAAFVRAARTVVPESREHAATPPTPLPAPEEIGIADLSGRAVGGYMLGERLGAGGFGAVYRATQPLIEREVAVKIILPQFADQPEFIRRFEAEAQLVARLEHPHIVPLYDYWREPGVAYLVMRLLRGGSLHALLQQGPPPLERTRRIVEQIGAALHMAHQAGVVHRDLKPANVLLDEEGNAYLADFGIAKDLLRAAELSFGGAFVGSPAYSSPEQIRAEPVTPQTDVYALGILLYELLTGQKPFDGPTPASYIQQHLSAVVPSLAARRAGLPPALDRTIQRATAKVASARFEHVAQLVLEVQQAIGRGDEEQRALPATSPQAVPPTLVLDLSEADNPYRGLRPFAESDAAAFFGREALVQQLLARLGEPGELSRFLAVVGPSGSGKSSAVRAGLVPALRRGGLPGSEHWYIVDLLPGARPVEELAAALCRVAPAGVEADDLAALLRADNHGLVRAARLVLPADPVTELLLVIDQFEELFTLTPDEATRARLLDSIVTAMLDERSRLRIVVTLRADFIDRPLQYVDFGELIRQRGELVLPLIPEELERAVAGPARRAGLALEEGLTAALVADVGNQPGGLPLLQHALSELFTRRQGRLLTHAAYAAIGGVAGALARSAEVTYARLDEASQHMARQLFLRLVTPGDGTEDTRRRVRLGELMAKGEAPVTADKCQPTAALHPVAGLRRSAVLDAFSAARLLTFDHDPTTREPTVEVAHEALLREWPRLRGWLDAARSDLLVQRRLAQEAAEWERAGYSAGFLATGARLSQYEALAEGTSVELASGEQTFVAASRDQRLRQAAAEEERQARELVQARAATEAQRSAANRLRLLVGALVLFLLAAAGLSAFAFGQQREAESQRTIADEQARLASVRAWSAAALNSLESDPERSLLLSLHATETTHALDGTVLPEAEDALRRAIQAAHVKHRLERPGAAYVMGAWSPDGQQIAIQSHAREGDKHLNIWDRSLTTQTFSMTFDTFGSWAAFSPDGKLLAAHAELFDTSTGEEPPPPSERSTYLYELPSGALRVALPILIPQFSADGAEVTGFSSAGLAGGNERIVTYAVANGELLRDVELPIAIADTNFAWLSPDGERCAEVLLNDEIVVFDSRTGAEVYRLGDEINSIVSGLQFSPDQRYLAVGRNNGVIEVYATENEAAVRRVHTLSGGETDIYALAFSPDGARLASASDRTITLWEVSSGRRQLVLPGHGARVIFLTFSPDGSELFSGDEAGGVRVWDVLPARELAEYFPSVYQFVLSPSRTRIVGTAIDSRARVYTVGRQAAPLELVGHQATVWDAHWSPDERLLATGAEDGSVRLWDATTGRQLAELLGHTDEVFSVSFSPDGSRVVSSGADRTARIWDVRTGDELLRLDHAQAVNRVLFSRDGRRLYAGLSQTGEILVWDTVSGELLNTWTQHRSSIFDIVFSPDGTRLATASRDGEARILDAESGETLRVLRGHTGDVRDVDFSPDGARVATASFDATVRVWDAVSGELLTTLPTGEGAVNVAFTASGQHLIASTGANSATLFTLDLAELIALGRERLTRTWMPEECRQYLQLEQCPSGM